MVYYMVYYIVYDMVYYVVYYVVHSMVYSMVYSIELTIFGGEIGPATTNRSLSFPLCGHGAMPAAA